jgi:hypothetical protein
VTKGYIKLPFAIETHYPVEAGAVQKQKVQGRTVLVKPLAHCVVVSRAARFQPFPLAKQVLTHHLTTECAGLNGLVEVDDMAIRVGEQGAWWPQV